MAGSHRKLDADDRRNPTYYEERAGHPKAKSSFYTPRDRLTKLRVRPRYSKEKFVIGLDLTCGAFYRYREMFALDIIQRGLHKQDWTKAENNWDIELLYDAAYNRLFSEDKHSHIPEYWRYCMLHDFLAKTSRWVQKHKLRLKKKLKKASTANRQGPAIANLHKRAHWSWGKLRESPKFDGFFQVQHTTIVVKCKDRKEVSIPVGQIIDKEGYTVTPVDVTMEDLSLAKLRTILEESTTCPYTPDKHALVYNPPDYYNEEVIEIRDQGTLYTAIVDQQVKKSDKIIVYMIEESEARDMTFIGGSSQHVANASQSTKSSQATVLQSTSKVRKMGSARVF
ncbi:hypothetical protein J4E89_007685 [Alternaria sp. Ai002NY15]|nr:hypothetical protein J4E89_007685 [Alternaria sp. Ai002NY15]